MNNTEIINSLIDQVEQTRMGGDAYKVLYIGSEMPHKHEFLFFIKPEVTLLSDRNHLAAVLDMTFKKIAGQGLHIRDIRLLTAGYMEKYDIIARHYGVINALSRDPLALLGNEARQKFRDAYGKAPEEVTLQGSLQFLKTFPAHTPESLDQIWQAASTVKLAGGTYCAKIEVQGKTVYLINGFHPKQLIHFTTPGRCILAFTLTGELDWSDARNRFIGKTNPADAAPGSLRNELLQRSAEFGLATVSASQNGFHLSAGPVEGLVELIRYCSDLSSCEKRTPDGFVFGRQLATCFSTGQIDKICNNSVVEHQGNKISTFDLTEEKNSDVALQLLKEAIIK